jgi:hypothetical protein
MKLTESMLKQIVKEELKKFLNETVQTPSDYWKMDAAERTPEIAIEFYKKFPKIWQDDKESFDDMAFGGSGEQIYNTKDELTTRREEEYRYWANSDFKKVINALKGTAPTAKTPQLQQKPT